jgi:hypothetical protein
MMVQRKFGIHKKENLNILFKLIQIIQNSVAKEIILLAVDHKKQ